MAHGRRYRLWRAIVAIALACLGVNLAPAEAQIAPTSAAPSDLDGVFDRLYNVDFGGAHALLDARIKLNPSDPLSYSIRAVTYLFAEMQRLKVLETEFFIDDKKVTSETGLAPDPAVRAKLIEAVQEARARANLRLQSSPLDRDALFALCMSANVMTDYTAFVERKQLRGLLLARELETYAERLIALQPPVYDAYHAIGVLEYINSRVPFYVKWFVRFKNIDGSEQKAVTYLQIVVDKGRYYGPFAKVLLAVLHLRAHRVAEARALLSDLARQYPRNPLFQRELARLTPGAR